MARASSVVRLAAMPPLHRVRTPADLGVLRLPLPVAIVLGEAVRRDVPMKVGTSSRGTWVLAVYQLRGSFVSALREAGARQFGPEGNRRGWILDERPADFRFGEGLGDDGTGRRKISDVLGDAYKVGVTRGKVRDAWARLQKIRPLLSDDGTVYARFKSNPEAYIESLWDCLAGAENSRVADYLDALDRAS